jgi:hypothetical protein
MGKTLATLLVVVCVVVLFILQSPDNEKEAIEQRLVGDILYVVTFTHDDVAKGNILLQVPFKKSVNFTEEISIAIDVNADNIFSDEETFVKEYPVLPRANWKNGFYVSGRTVLTDDLTARVTVDDETFTLTTLILRHEVGDLFGVNQVTNPERAMKGWSQTYTAHAGNDDTTDTDIFIGDISQKDGECAPTTAVNVLYYLLNTQNLETYETEAYQTLKTELKSVMKWNNKDGVTPENYVNGLTTWADERNIPLTIKMVGDAHGNTTFEEIQRALERGEVVNLRIKFIDPNSKKAVGGHMVTVVDTYERSGKTFIDINDPATPEGTEVIQLHSNQFTRYSPWEGITLMSWAFTHSIDE